MAARLTPAFVAAPMSGGCRPNSSSDSEPPCKRLRTGGLEPYPAGHKPCHGAVYSAMNPQDAMNEPVVVLERDQLYYTEGADCVIRVESTLFRVHRFLLARDSSAFQDMFSLPVGDTRERVSQEGYSDHNPIHLCGETTDSFRALLSVLYALPHEIAAYNSASADISALLTIAAVTNKYHFNSTSAWAISAVHSVISEEYGKPTHPLANLSTAPSSALTRILEVALCCGHSGVVDQVVERWCDRIERGRIDPRPAMHTADKYDLCRLKGIAYYMQLMDDDLGMVDIASIATNAITQFPTSTPAAAETANSEGEPEEDDSLMQITFSQQIRLLNGFHSLVRLWQRLAVGPPPPFPKPDGCTYHVHGCIATFAALWKEVARSERTLSFGPWDILGRLRSVEEQLNCSSDFSLALSPVCKRAALLAIRDLRKEMREGLADRFVDIAATRVGELGAT